eukprot:1494414-Amphidinium_carterae.1
MAHESRHCGACAYPPLREDELREYGYVPKTQSMFRKYVKMRQLDRTCGLGYCPPRFATWSCWRIPLSTREHLLFVARALNISNTQRFKLFLQDLTYQFCLLPCSKVCSRVHAAMVRQEVVIGTEKLNVSVGMVCDATGSGRQD